MISIPGRIPVQISPFFWLLIAMIGWFNSSSILGTAIWAVVILVSVLIHEYGHALTALAFRQNVKIDLVGLGGVTTRQGPKLSRWQEFIIVLNGPIAGFILFGLAYFAFGIVDPRKSILVYALQVAIEVNLFWTLLNLLPILPLDGGHLLRIFLEGLFGVRGLKASLFVSMLLAGGIGVYFFLIQQILMGALLFMFAFESYRAWEEVKNLKPEDDDQKLQNLIREGVAELQAGNLTEALTKFSYVRGLAPKGMLYVTATEYGARILSEQGRYKQAYDWLYPLKNRLSIEYVCLLQQLAYRVQEWEEAIKIGEKAYQERPSVDIASLNALSCGVLGKATPAVGWLRCAVQLGMSDVKKMVERRDFDAVRHVDVFQKWLNSL